MTSVKYAQVGMMAMAALMAGVCLAEEKAPKSEASAAAAVAIKEGVPGGVAAQVVSITAKVTKVDAKKRTFTIKRADGTKRTFKAGPEVVNFDQIKKGDDVTLTVAESVVVFLSKDGKPAGDAAAGGVALAPVGAKPAAAVGGVVEVSAKIKALDLEGRKATLEFPDGVLETVPVRPDVDMSKAQVGDSVTIRMTEAVAVKVESAGKDSKK